MGSTKTITLLFVVDTLENKDVLNHLSATRNQAINQENPEG